MLAETYALVRVLEFLSQPFLISLQILNKRCYRRFLPMVISRIQIFKRKGIQLKSGANFILLFHEASFTWKRLQMTEIGVGKAKGLEYGNGMSYAKIAQTDS